MTIIPFPKHHWARCLNRECLGCHLCTGGLAYCTECGGYEGAMATDCPRERMTDQQMDEVYAGTLDYDRRRGWVAEASVHSPAYYKKD